MRQPQRLRLEVAGGDALVERAELATGDDDAAADEQRVHERARAEHERGDRVGDPRMIDAVEPPQRDVGVLARLQRADLGLAAEAAGAVDRAQLERLADVERRAGRGASRASEQRLAQLAAELAGLVGGGAVDPEPDRRAVAEQAPTGAMPAPSRALELGQCATPVPVSPKRRTSCSSRCTQCASQTSSPSQPSRSRYSTGRQPNSSMQKRSSSSVSAMCVCSRTPRARASSADSRISSCVTLNGEHGASAIRTIASGEVSW